MATTGTLEARLNAAVQEQRSKGMVCEYVRALDFIPKIAATIVETTNCPSAPILNSPDLNASVTLSPVKIIGVLFIITFTINFALENTALNITAIDSEGL